MRHKIKLALAGLVTFIFIIILGATAYAWTNFRSGQSVTIAKGETVDSGLWMGARDLNIAGTINGDLYCGAQTLDISGTVKGDVICAAQNLNISGTVKGSLRAAGQTINLSGSVGRNASLAGQTVNFGGKSNIGGDLSIAGSNLNLDGKIGRDLAFTAATANLSGQVGRDVTGRSEHFYLTNGAKVSGSIDYTSKNALTNTGAQIAGKITQHQPRAPKPTIPSMLALGGFAILLFFMLLVSALAITAVLPQFVYRVTNNGMRRPWAALGIGLLAGLAVPVAFFILLLTVVGLPLAILLLLAWLLINLSSGLFSAFWLGRQIWRGQRNALLISLAGAITLLILYMIPVVGIIALVLAVWLGQGMLIMEIFSHIKRPSYQTEPK